MATHVVNNTAERDADRSSTGWIVAIIALLAIVLLFLFAGAFFTGDNGGTTVPDTGGAAGSVDLDVGASGGVGAPTGGGAQ